MTLYEMIKVLSDIDDITWGRYIFSRDLLQNRISDEEKTEMIIKAIECGYQKADEIIDKWGYVTPCQLAQKLSLQIKSTWKEQIENQLVFGLFTSPNVIEIMEEPLQRAIDCAEVRKIIRNEQISALILGHEIFHYLEYEDPKIYSQSRKIVLWKCLGYRYQSTIGALSEIAAMYFSKRLNDIVWSPVMLDVILYYACNPIEAEKIFWEILKLQYNN